MSGFRPAGFRKGGPHGGAPRGPIAGGLHGGTAFRDGWTAWRRGASRNPAAPRNAVSPWEAGAPRSAASRWEAAANPWLGAIARCSRTGSSNPSPSSRESANFRFRSAVMRGWHIGPLLEPRSLVGCCDGYFRLGLRQHGSQRDGERDERLVVYGVVPSQNATPLTPSLRLSEPPTRGMIVGGARNAIV